MKDIEKSCNLGYYHAPHRSRVVLLRNAGPPEMVRVSCPGKAPETPLFDPNLTTPGWLHQCKPVGHEVWTVQGATCAYCGTFHHQRKGTDEAATTQ